MKSNTSEFKPKLDDYDKTNQFSRNAFQTLKLAYRPFKTKIILSLIIGFFSRLIILSNANFIGIWVDSFCVENCVSKYSIFEHFQSLHYIILLSVITSLGFVLTLSFRVMFSRLSAYAVSKIYDEVTLRTSRYPLRFFDLQPAGRIITRFSSDYGNVFRLFGGPLAEFFSIIFDLIAMIILVSIASPIFLIFVLTTGFFNYLVYRFNRKKLRTARRELSASRSPSIAHFAETTQGANLIRVFKKQDSFKSRFRLLDQYYLKNKLNTVQLVLRFSFFMNSLSSLLFLFLGISSIYLVKNSYVSVGAVGVAFGFVALSSNTMQMFFEWLTQLEEAMVGVERLDQFLRFPIEPGSALPISTSFIDTGHRIFTGEEEAKSRKYRLTNQHSAQIEIKNLFFRYSDDLPWILKDLSFVVAPGEKLGIVGKTGSGKTSLISALFYLYKIDKGEIRIDGKRPKLDESNNVQKLQSLSPYKTDEVDLNIYRRAISFIPQDPILFIGTLRLNLDFYSEFSDSRIFEVLEQVGLKHWVQNHNEGLDFIVEEKGRNLSLGERQLICMARCLLQNAPIVVMDEATSSVDPQSEEIMIRATDEFFKGRTQLIIAHRLSTLQKCDRILWIENGELLQIGPAKEVLMKFE